MSILAMPFIYCGQSVILNFTPRFFGSFDCFSFDHFRLWFVCLKFFFFFSWKMWSSNTNRNKRAMQEIAAASQSNQGGKLLERNTVRNLNAFTDKLGIKWKERKKKQRKKIHFTMFCLCRWLSCTGSTQG